MSIADEEYLLIGIMLQSRQSRLLSILLNVLLISLERFLNTAVISDILSLSQFSIHLKLISSLSVLITHPKIGLWHCIVPILLHNTPSAGVKRVQRSLTPPVVQIAVLIIL